MEKIKIESGEQYFDSFVTRLNSFRRPVSELKTAWNKLAAKADIPAWTNETLKHCINTGTRVVEDAVDNAIARKDKAIQALYREEYRSSLQEVSSMIKEISDRSSLPWAPASTYFEYTPPALKSTDRLPVEDGEIVITEEYLAEIRPLFDRHLIHPDDIEMFHKHEAVRLAWNELIQFSEEKGYRIQASMDRNYGITYPVNPEQLGSVITKVVQFKQIV